MVKISIQKGKKTIKSKPKPRQKQKQKQSQKVVVNMGKPQHKPINTPVYIPQSNPIVMKPQTDQSMIELIKYLRESEGQKTATKEKEKNELEREKKIDTPEEKQVYFSTVDSQTVLTPLGNAEKLKFDTLIGNTPSTKYVLPANMKASAGPYNPMSFYDSLKQRADLLGGNPATGQLSLSTNAPLQISQTTSTSVLRHVAHTSNSQLTDLLRSRITPIPPEPEPPAPQPIQEPTPPAPQPQPEETKEEILLEETKDDDEIFDAPEEEEPAAPEVEQQAAPLEITTNEPTEAQQIIRNDSTTTNTILKTINDISPPTHLEDLIGEKPAAEQADEAIQMMQGLLSPTKAATGAADDDGPGSGGGIPNTTKPPYTEEEINKMTVEKLGQVITANNITDDMFQPLIFNDQKKRIYKANNLGKQIDKPELRKYVLAHYGFT